MLQPGQVFAHFKIIRKLGEGGMGQVYLAEDQKLHRQVALKILSKDVFAGQERLERFHREARTAAQVSHPNVMAIYDIGSDKPAGSGTELNYIVMEYVKGKSLDEYVRDDATELSKKIRLAEKIAAGLASAHHMNIVHRDIKFENIIVDQEANPKILDFGLAKPVDPLQMEGSGESASTISQELTRAGKILGTVSFMSPEQVQGKPVDNRSDIFSFGILMYRMFTGEAPFKGETQVSTMAKILETPHDPPRRRNADIPPTLERVIDKCLRKDAGDRYQDTRDLVVDLRDLRRESDSGVTGAISAVTDGYDAAAQQPGFFSSRGRVTALIIGAVAVIAVLALGTGLFDGLTGGRTGGGAAQELIEGSLAIIGFQNKTGDTELDWMETGLPEILLTDLSQAADLHIFSRQRILDCFPKDRKDEHTHEECVTAARSLGADRLLSGTFFKLGDKIRIDARLEDVNTGQIILGEKVVGDNPFELVDSLSNKIAVLLDLDTRNRVTQFTSQSPEAFKQYHLGMEYFWANEYDSAVDLFRQAIAIDSSFALPYMRIGMASIFRGRQGEGIRYLSMAGQYQDRLPVRERDLLSAYTDTWVNRNFDHAFTKFTALLRSYPDDPEIRTIYALFVHAFQQDIPVALAHLDTVLLKYPTYPFALEQYAALLENQEEFGRAIEYTERVRDALPEALQPRYTLTELYVRQGRDDDAMQLAQQLAKDYPNNQRPLRRLIVLSIHARDFDAALDYSERFRNLKPDDPFTIDDYNNYLANIATWQGKFNRGMDYRFKSLDQALGTDDSLSIFQEYQTIGLYYQRFKVDDSFLYYSRAAHDYANPMNKVGYAFSLISVDTANVGKARPILEESMKEYRARFPREFWTVLDHFESLFEGVAAADTSAIIEAYNNMINAQNQRESQDYFQMGKYMVRSGRSGNGIETLSRFVSGPYESTSAWTNLVCHYYIGLAQEDLGNRQEAVRYYQEVLRFWSDSDRRLDIIEDTRERLSKLTG